MEQDEITRLVKEHFDGILTAFFDSSITITYSNNEKIIPQALPTFKAIQYFDPSFNYYFQFYNYLNFTLDFINCTISNEHSKLVLSKDILTLDFIKQISLSNYFKSDYRLYLHNLITHLFAFLHECGHLNIEIEENKKTTETNHFEEYNCDYFAISRILQYFFTLKKSHPTNYSRMILEFGSEEVLFKTVIIISLMIFYLECVSKEKITDTEDYPAIQKRFCHLIYKFNQQLPDNFSFLFKSFKLEKFLTDIFKSLNFIETTIFDNHKMQFNELLKLCIREPTLIEIQRIMTNSKKFKRFNE